MNTEQRVQIINNFRAWYRQVLIPGHLGNTTKLSDIRQFNINPFLLRYLANYLEGNSSPLSLAKALIYPRILGTSITTSFGTNMQSFITEGLGAFGSAIAGIDIEFDDQIDGRHKYCQLKSGPNAINRDDVITISNHFRDARNRLRTNNVRVQIDDFIFCLLYGEPDEKNSFIRELEKDYVVFIGREFWTRFTGDDNFYRDLILSIDIVADEVNMSVVVDEVIQDLSNQIEERFNEILNS